MTGYAPISPAAHLQEVTKLLPPSVLQVVVTLQPFKHILQAPSHIYKTKTHSWLLTNQKDAKAA